MAPEWRSGESRYGPTELHRAARARAFLRAHLPAAAPALFRLTAAGRFAPRRCAHRRRAGEDPGASRSPRQPSGPGLDQGAGSCQRLRRRRTNGNACRRREPSLARLGAIRGHMAALVSIVPQLPAEFARAGDNMAEELQGRSLWGVMACGRFRDWASGPSGYSFARPGGSDPGCCPRRRSGSA